LRGPVESLLEEERYDVVGLSLMATQLSRTLEIARFFREKRLSGALVVGGLGTSYIARQLKDLVDATFYGEAEETWPEYLADLEKGEPKAAYQRLTKPDMTAVPIPRWDLIREDIPAYSAASVQTTRGCHFDCAFCDVIYTYGRKPRSKTIAQILEEIRILEGMNVKMIYLADDNFCGNKRYAKELLRELVKLNNSFSEPLSFLTQVDITIAEDDELLELMTDANLFEVQIGIESVNEDSLREMNKLPNTRLDLVEAVRKIQSYGLVILAHMIIGTDSDDKDTFRQTADFVREANIVHHICHPLMAPPGTKLWNRLKREGRVVAAPQRLIDRDHISSRVDVLTNIVPRRMSRVELFQGLADYWEEVNDPAHYLGRAIGFIEGVTRKPQVRNTGFKGLWKRRRMLVRMLWYYMFQVPKDHRKAFFTVFRTAGRLTPYLMPRVIFAHTGFVMDHKRALLAAAVARERAVFETANPDELTIMPRNTPIPMRLRENAGKVFSAAYQRVRARVNDKETLYRIVIDASLDYSDRFGESLVDFDEFQLQHLNASCDRRLGEAALPPAEGTSELPEGRPPAGVAREILDGLDHAIRIREHR